MLIDDTLAHIAMRAGLPPIDSVIARDSGHHGQAWCAAPADLKKYGAPRHPGDLSKHCLITITAVAAHNRWQFVVKGQTVHEAVRGQIQVNSNAAVLPLVLASAGIGRINSVLADRLIG